MFSLYSTSFYITAMDLQTFLQDKMLLEKQTPWEPKVLQQSYTAPQAMAKYSVRKICLKFPNKERIDIFLLYIHSALRKILWGLLLLPLLRTYHKHCLRHSQIIRIFLLKENKNSCCPTCAFINSLFTLQIVKDGQKCKRQLQINIIL